MWNGLKPSLLAVSVEHEEAAVQRVLFAAHLAKPFLQIKQTLSYFALAHKETTLGEALSVWGQRLASDYLLRRTWSLFDRS